MHESVVGENRKNIPRGFARHIIVKSTKFMQFEEFQNLARLAAIAKLDPDELSRFEAGRREFGERAEAYVAECRKLGTAIALSLCPCEPDPMTKERLFEKIRQSGAPDPAKISSKTPAVAG